MADMFEYLSWRGDLAFEEAAPNAVDALILSTLVYCDFSGIVPEDGISPVPLQTAAEALLTLPDPETRVRVKNDLRLYHFNELSEIGIGGGIRISDVKDPLSRKSGQIRQGNAALVLRFKKLAV
jgi:hypothetical protein